MTITELAPTVPTGAQDTRARRARRAAAPLPLAAGLALTFTTLAAVYSLCRVFPGWSFFSRFALVAVAAHSVAWFGRVRGWGLARALVLWAAVSATVIGRLYLPGTQFLGLVPTLATWDAGWRAVADDFAQFRVTVTPVTDSGGYALALVLSVALIAFVADSFAFRAYGRAEAIVPSALVFVVASSLGYDRLRMTSTALWLVAALVTVTLLRATHSETTTPWLGGGPGRRVAAWTAAGLSVAVVAAAGAAIVGPRLPGAGEEALLDTRGRSDDSTQVVSPLVEIQSRLVARSRTEMFTVRASAPAYWRLMALESFDGAQWSQDKRYDDAARLPTVQAADGVRQDFTITSLGGSWMPSAFSTVGLNSEVDVLYNEESATLLRRNGDLFTGFSYSTVSQLPTATKAELQGSTSGDGPGDEYLSLPDDFPEELRTLAHQIADAGTSAYDKAILLQNYFRAFDYDINVPRGHNDRVMQAFIERRSGYCEQFAGTFAAFARALGLASRVAVGFTPGETDGDGLYHVLGRNAHAWPEVWFDGIGWVLFEPTPGRGAPNAEDYTGVSASQDGTFAGADPVQAGDQTASGPTTTAATGDGQGRINEEDGAFGGSATTVSTVPPTQPPGVAGTGERGGVATVGWLLLGAAVLVLLWLVAMPPLVRLLQVGRAERPSERLLLAWRDAERALAAAGTPRRPDETPQEFAERAWRRTGCDRGALERLAVLATASAYSAQEPSDELVDEADRLRGSVVTVLRRRSTMLVRLKHRLDPRLA